MCVSLLYLPIIVKINITASIFLIIDLFQVDNTYSTIFYDYHHETQRYAFFAHPEGNNSEQVFLKPYEDENRQKIIRGETIKKSNSAEVYVFEIMKSKKLNPGIVIPDSNVTASVPVAEHCNCCQCTIISKY